MYHGLVLEVLQVAVPGERHEHVRRGQQQCRWHDDGQIHAVTLQCLQRLTVW